MQTGPTSEVPQGFVAMAWTAIGLPGRLAVIVLAAVLVIAAIVWGLKRVGQRGRRSLLWGVTAVCLVGVVTLGFWASKLPEPKGSTFILWHQLVRIGAALSGTGFVVFFMALAMPWVLDRIEGRGFIPFVAVRHVRASKSGFLTVISFLSIAGVGVSAFALCAVVSVMGGFGADLKRKILGNNAHMKVEAGAHGGFTDWQPLLDTVRKVKGVRAATPVVAGEAMASSSSNRAGSIIRGIDPKTIGDVIDLLQNIEVGKFEYLEDPKQLIDLPPNTVIGIGRTGEKYTKGPNIRPYFDKSPDGKKAPEPVYPGIIVGR
ncbi:MAG TPA: ABC transporter permease, partial [Polyangiaceae bacterium]|nr:ABC transporter permease [Polyangiaceae bacterium]